MSRTDRRVHTASALVAVACALVLTQVGWGHITWWAIPALVAVVAASELCIIKLQIGKQHWMLAFTESSISAAFVFATGSWMVPAIAAGVLLAMLLHRTSLLKVEFNVAQ